MMLHVSISLLFSSITDRLEIVHIVNRFAWYNDLPQGQFGVNLTKGSVYLRVR